MRIQTNLNVFLFMRQTDGIVMTLEGHLPIAIDLAIKGIGSQKIVDPLQLEEHDFPFQLIRAVWGEQRRMNLQGRQTVAIAGPSWEQVIVDGTFLIQGLLESDQALTAVWVVCEAVQGAVLAFDLCGL
jgi:hypothetical protein